MGVGVKFVLTETGEGLADAFPKAFTQVGRHVAKAGFFIARGVHDNARDRLNKDSRGALRASWLSQPVVITKRKVVTGTISSDLPYAKIHDKGGVIRPKKSRILTIPIASKVKRLRGARGPRDYQGTWVSRKGKPPLFIEDDTGDVLFVGVPSVRIEATNYFTDAWEQRAEKALDMVGVGFFDDVEKFGFGES